LKEDDEKVPDIKKSAGPVGDRQRIKEKEVYGYMALSTTFFILALFPDL